MFSTGQQGWLRCVILGLAVASVALAGIMFGHCYFVKGEVSFSQKPGDFFDYSDFLDLDLGFSDYWDDISDLTTIEINGGFVSARAEGMSSCVEYPSFLEHFIDTPFKVAKGMAIMTVVFISLAMLSLLLVVFFLDAGKKAVWLLVRIFFVASFIFQCATFVLFASDICDVLECSLGVGGIIAALNCFFLLILCVLSFLAPPPEKPVINSGCGDTDEEADAKEAPTTAKKEQIEQAPATSGVEMIRITVVDGPYGEKITTKEVTHPDGTKSVTTTVGDTTDQNERHRALPGRYGSEGY